mmetsp:Transcript_12629/g.28886  ORF Transcript_12629/g.28886 Transcript_12629/m.28886 type:complete len:210 (-) Transcript_12629:97-726(-)
MATWPKADTGSFLGEVCCLEGATKLCLELASLFPGPQRRKWARPTTRTRAPVQSETCFEWQNYDPDSDTYDPRTAPCLPEAAHASAFEVTRRQVLALRKRIAMGGREEVLAHYRTVLKGLEESLLKMFMEEQESMKLVRDSKPTKHCCTRSTSSTSTESTPLVYKDSDEDVDDWVGVESRDLPEKAIPVSGATTCASSLMRMTSWFLLI